VAGRGVKDREDKQVWLLLTRLMLVQKILGNFSINGYRAACPLSRDNRRKACALLHLSMQHSDYVVFLVSSS
jgi:hypothetical protein